jgi:hypothetical protein
MTLAALLSGCQSAPVTTGVPISPSSSLLAVDVLFPAPLSRDPSLVQVFFMKGPIHDGQGELPEPIPATFVKWSRAYLLDPEPGSYPWWRSRPSRAALERPSDRRVTDTVWSGTSSDAMILPAELVHRTTTTVAPGDVAFMGALRVRRGDHIRARAVPADDLQKRIAERIRPGVTSQSGLRGWLKRTRTVDLEKTSLSNQPADRESFLHAALEDLGGSPWAAVVAREAPSGESPVATRKPPAPRPEPGPDPPEAPAAKPQPAVAAPQAAPAELESSDAKAMAAPPEPEPLPAAPKPTRSPAVPPDSPLAKIQLGMRHDEVLAILGSPDGRIDRRTARAWIPFYDGPDAHQREWIYEGIGRVVFSHYQEPSR